MATVTFSAADDVLYAYLAGEIDHDAAQNLRIQLDDALLTRTPRTLVLDFGGVGFMDSSGIVLILGRQRCACTLGGALLKTAVSEAVTNCIVHAYPSSVGPIIMTVAVYPGRLVKITVADKGVGILDIPKAMEPLFTTGNPEERSGLGFSVMQSFMDKVSVHSQPGKGTRVTLTKRLDERPAST